MSVKCTIHLTFAWAWSRCYIATMYVSHTRRQDEWAITHFLRNSWAGVSSVSSRAKIKPLASDSSPAICHECIVDIIIISRAHSFPANFAKFRRPVCKIPQQNCPNSVAHCSLPFVSNLSFILFRNFAGPLRWHNTFSEPQKMQTNRITYSRNVFPQEQILWINVSDTHI